MSRAEFYRLVSRTIRERLESAPESERAGIIAVTRALAEVFALHNSKFDAVRFYRDAGVHQS